MLLNEIINDLHYKYFVEQKSINYSKIVSNTGVASNSKSLFYLQSIKLYSSLTWILDLPLPI